MEELLKYIQPELVVLVAVCYFLGQWLKKAGVKGAYVPFINTAVSIVLASLYVVATCPIGNYKEIALAMFTAIVQGALCSGGATLYYESKKQARKLNGD